MSFDVSDMCFQWQLKEYFKDKFHSRTTYLPDFTILNAVK